MIIITGAAGFIGSNLTAELENRFPHKKLILCDWFGEGDKWRNLAARKPYDMVPPEDLFDYIQEHNNDIEIIFHMGASSSTMEKNVDYIMDVNYYFSLNLWNLCSTYSIRFIYASSAATYGDGSLGFDDDTSLTYLNKLRPLNPYGWSKHLFDLAVIQRVERKEAMPPQWVGLKFFNVYGPNENHKANQKSVISTMYPKVKEGKPARLFKSYNCTYPDGEQKRDFIWVDDCIEVMIWLYKNKTVSNIFNVGTGKARSFLDLAKAVFAASKKKEVIEYYDMPENLRDKYQYFTEANMKKLKSYGYKIPFTSLEDASKIYIEKYLNNEKNPYR